MSRRGAAWSCSDASARAIYLVAAALGVAAFAIVYGATHGAGTSAYWQMPQADERMALMGYRYFLADGWHWPLFVNEAVNVPYAKSLVFLDCIPLWALVNKAVATAAPPWERFSADAYLGLWHVLAYALQPCLGVACLRALGHRSWRTGIATALCFVAVPTWIFRYGHPALSAHWILLWALYLYLRTPAGTRPPRSLGIAKLGQLGVAALVAPYHAVFSLLVYGPSVLRSRHPRTIAIWLPLGATVVGLVMWSAGYFAAEIRGRQWGYDWNSANVLSWLVPPRSGLLGDAQWIVNVNPTPYQYEGYAYLGLGMLLLVALLAPRIRELGGAIRRHQVLFAVVCACCVVALSNRIFIGPYEVAHYHLPGFLRWFTNQFRSPGRFVWIPIYALMVFVLHRSFLRFAAGRRFAIVAFAAALQVADATGDWRWQRATTSVPQGVWLPLDAWRPLVHAHRAVTILPPSACIDHEHAVTLDAMSRDIQFLASQRALPINGTYSAREVRRCATEEETWPTMPLEDGMLYVLLPPALAVAERFEARGASCGTFAFGRVCSTERGAIDAAIRASALQQTPGPITLRRGEPLELAVAGVAGWTAPAGDGRWTETSVASLLLRLDRDPPARATLALHAEAYLCGAREVQLVDVLLGERPLGTLRFDASTNDPAAARALAIVAPDALRGAFTIQLRPRDLRSPAQLGCGDDRRRLGVRVTRLSLE